MRFDFNALAAFEEKSGRPALKAIGEMEDGDAMILDLRLLCWAGLKRHHPEISLEETGDILSECPDAVMEGIARAMAPGKKGAAPGKPRRAPAARR